MATYVLPQVLVFQDFNIRPAAEIRDLNALITGPHAELFRCSEADEKALVGLGTYDHVGANVGGVFKTCYTWPEKASSSLIDTAYTNLCIDDALLRYFTDTSQLMTRTASNKIHHPTKNFKQNTATYPRHADFLDRDVQVGDVVRVIGYEAGDGGTALNLCTYVKNIEADQVASSVATAVSDVNNPNDQVASVSASAGTGNTGAVVISATAGATWDALNLGLISETYTVTVTQASTGGDHTTARLRVTSASGLDDNLNLTPVAATNPTTISALGSVGLTATFAAGDFVVNDTYTITVNREWQEPVATSGGTYTGLTDRTYIVTVTEGGDYSVPPQVTVTTTDGTDFSGPHNVYDLFGSGTGTSSTTSTTAAPAACESITLTIGQYGVTVCLSGHGLRLGDRFTIDAVAAKDGNFRTLVLGHDLESMPLG